MAADATAQPTGSARTREQALPPVEQPPRSILRDGKRVDISHLTGEALYEALISDQEEWGYRRLSAETGRSRARLRKWVVNVGIAQRTGKAPDDKTFRAPCGYHERSPWWHAGEARETLEQMGVMTRDGRMIPHKPTGRTPGSAGTAPHRWSSAPMRDTAADVYREYLKLTGRKRSPMSDRAARAELCRQYGVNRDQLARRIKTGRDLVEGAKSTPAEVDRQELAARLNKLLAEQRAAGYSERGASERARAALAAETGLTRRQIAGYVAEAKKEAAARAKVDTWAGRSGSGAATDKTG